MVTSTRKIIISCAVTGSVHTPSMSDLLPITGTEIAEQSVAAAKAGAAILHLHARDPRDGRPSADPELFMQFVPAIHDATDAVINITYRWLADDERGRAVGRTAAPEPRDVLAQYGVDELWLFPDR